MKKYVLLAFISLFCVSSSAWAQYVKLTAENGTVSWIPVAGTINGTNIEIYKSTRESAIDTKTKGSIDLNEVWSQSGGSGTHYQVTCIGSYAFSNCSGLTAVTIPNSVTTINSYSFSGSSGLTSVTIPNSITTINSCSFQNCSGLRTVTIPNSVTSIGGGAFDGCIHLTSVTIPNSVVSIASYAFRNCSGLISILSNMTEVFSTGYGTFYGCDNATLYVPKSMISQYRNTADWNRITNIQEYCFDFSAQNADGVTIYYNIVSEADKTCEVSGGIDKSGTYDLGAPTYLFTDYEGVVNIPSSANGYRVIGIGKYAFKCCGNLTSLTIPNTVTYIDKNAFSNCCGFSSLTIPNSVTRIENSAFSNNWDLTSITIPNSVTFIGNYAFSGCLNLTSITSEIKNVFKTGDEAFENCDNATLYVPSGTKSQYQNTADWNSITDIKEVPDFSAKNADGVTIYYNIVSEADKTCEVSGGIDKSGTYDLGAPTYLFTDYEGVVNIPSSANGYRVIGIGKYAFKCCGNLTSLTIPNTVTYIDEYAFYGCCGFTSLTIPNSVTSIGAAAFHNNWNLASITIPNSVIEIDKNAFANCFGLTSITSEIKNVFKTGVDAFYNCDNVTLYVPKGLVNTYRSTADWNRISNIQECWFDFSATNADGVTIFYKIVSETNKTCEVTYGIDKSSYDPTVVYNDYSGVVNIPSSANGYKVIGIGDYAFAVCENLTSVTIPNSGTYIKEYAFESCNNLTSITIPNSLTSIGENAFEFCNNLTSITIPNSVTSIGKEAFYGCYNLTSITIPNSVTSIGESAFYDCRSLSSITIPNSVTSIEYGTFMSCTSLTSITIPNSVTSIEESALAGCSSLTSITIPSSVTSIGAFAFSNCRNLTSITSEIRNVFVTGAFAFRNCDENATLYVPGGTKDLYQNMADWNRFSNIEEIINYIPLSLSCNNRGKVIINEGVQFTNDMGDVSIKEEMDNTFIFQPNDNCALSQVLINGQDVTESIVNNRLTMKVNKNSNMIVLFDNKGYDVNDDGKVDISDVVKLVNVILVQ